MLNELTPTLEERVAPTDCRLRPDQHSLELGQYDQVQYSALCWAAGHSGWFALLLG